MPWERVWGATEFVVVDGETGTVYAKPSAPDTMAGVYQWDGTPFGWSLLGGTSVTCVTAGWAPHSSLYGLDAQGDPNPENRHRGKASLRRSVVS
jgi:hypothetical protein